MNENFVDFIVSSDPEVVADLWARFEQLGSYGLAEYALGIGLRPPGFEEGQRHSISEYVPPGSDGQGYLVWSAGLWSPDPEDQDGEGDDEDDGPDPWDSV